MIFNEIKIFEKVDFSNFFCCIFAASNFKLIDMENTDPILEARRYVANASEIIEKSVYDPETNLYRDKKYVRIAGNTLWSGCLIALEAVLQIRKGKGRPSIEKYKEAAGKRDRTLLKYVNAGYETMHLFKMSRSERNRCTEIILTYYRLHVPNFPELKSLGIMQELFV